jgi:hypothetical protein
MPRERFSGLRALTKIDQGGLFLKEKATQRSWLQDAATGEAPPANEFALPHLRKAPGREAVHPGYRVFRNTGMRSHNTQVNAANRER